MTTFDVEEAYRRYQEGISIVQLSKELKKGPHLISVEFKKKGFKMRKEGRKRVWNKEKVLRLFKLYEGGMSLQEVANTTGVTRERIRQLFYEYDLKTKGRGNKETMFQQRKDEALKKQLDKALKYYDDEQCTVVDVLNKFLISRTMFLKEMSKRGYATPYATLTIRNKKKREKKALEMYEVYESGKLLSKMRKEFDIKAPGMYRMFREFGLSLNRRKKS